MHASREVVYCRSAMGCLLKHVYTSRIQHRIHTTRLHNTQIEKLSVKKLAFIEVIKGGKYIHIGLLLSL